MTTGRGGDAGSFDDDAGMSMEDLESLLDEDMEFRSLRRGDVLEGIVMETSREGVLVDIGSKSEGIIPLNEMHSLGADPLSKVKRGDELLVYILQPEGSEGQVILSLDRARGEQGWRTLQKRFEDQESFEGEVTGFNKGGLLVNVEGVNAFVPLSQVVGARPSGDDGDGLQANVGRQLRLKVIEINRRRNRVILSERAAMQEYRSQQKDRLLAELREGEIRRGRITSVRDFGVFVDLGGADGLAHISELTWERGRSPQEVYKVGDEVDAFVMKVDPETKKIALSLRRAQPQRWHEIVDNYRVGQIVPGRVTKLVTFGAFARIEGPVEGLIHVSELSDRRIQHPREVVQENDIVPLRIVRIERDKERIGLSLRQARDDAERQGWEFDGAGRPIGFPESLQADVESRLGVADGRTAAPREERPPATPERDEEPAPDEGPAPEMAPSPAREPAPAGARRDRERDRDRGQRETQQPGRDEPPVGGSFEALRGFRALADEQPTPEDAASDAVRSEAVPASAAEAQGAGAVGDEVDATGSEPVSAGATAVAAGGEQPEGTITAEDATPEAVSDAAATASEDGAAVGGEELRAERTGIAEGTPADETASAEAAQATRDETTTTVEAEAEEEEVGDLPSPPRLADMTPSSEPAAGEPEGTVSSPQPLTATSSENGHDEASLDETGSEPEPPPDGVGSRPGAPRGGERAETSQ